MAFVVLSKVVNNPKILAIEIFAEGELEIIAGLEPGDAAETLSVYPNPTNGVCTMELPAESYSFGDMLYTVYMTWS